MPYVSALDPSPSRGEPWDDYALKAFPSFYRFRPSFGGLGFRITVKYTMECIMMVTTIFLNYSDEQKPPMW